MRSLWWALVRFGFRLLYNELAFTYDGVSYIVSLGEWRCWQRTALKYLDIHKSSRILELAYGTGNLQLDLQNKGFNTIGIDVSPFMGNITRKKLQEHGLTPRLIRGMAQQLPFAGESLSAIICTFPTEFIFEKVTLTEINRVLQPDGQLIVVLNGDFSRNGIVESGLEGLYRITGQRGGNNLHFSDFFAVLGFDVQAFNVPCPRSVAQVIIVTQRG